MEPTTSFPLASPNIVVIQCSSCKTIVGDTAINACAAVIGAIKFISVQAASDVTVDRIPQKETIDNNQQYTYFHVCCSGCGSVIGRMYTEAPIEMHPVLNTFAFDVSKCSSYRVGSADIRVSGQNTNSGGVAVGGAGAAGAATEMGAVGAAAVGGNNDGELLARIENLEAELLKLQGMILLHDGQLQTLPGYPVAADSGTL